MSANCVPQATCVGYAVIKTDCRAFVTRPGLADWFSDKYLPLMEEKGLEAWPEVKTLL